jgi:hypothetical protein
MLRRVTLVFLTAVLASAAALAATFSGTLNAPSRGGASTLTWNGGPFTGSNGVGGVLTTCTSLTCDTYSLTVNVPSTFYSSNPNYGIQVAINWDSNLNDLDVYISDSGGNVVCSSTSGSTNQEFADCGPLAAGQYTVSVQDSLGANVTYKGTITLAPEPAISSGKARYKPGNFTFTAPQVLVRPPHTYDTTAAGPLFYQQDAEPRVSHDALGNIYSAAIQGVPAGTDMWKSMDGGATWTYLGQPDGTQAAAATGLATGVGIGGGDEDFVIGPNGDFALSSLWLGGVTNCDSNDGATTWLCNPMASDVPEDDRQWLAWYGDQIVYLTTRNLGTLNFNTDSVYVVKSFDGGKTFTQFTEVTKPVLGIRAGDEGNIVVDQRNGAVYLTFIGAGLEINRVYVAKSTDGGQSFIIKAAYIAPTGVNLQHVFPSIAVDNGGGVHLAFNDGRVSYLTSSADGGATWTVPIRLNNSADSKTSLEPWVVAGDYGKVNVFFYGTPDPSFMSANAQWKVFMAQTLNAFANVPLVTQKAATDIMHNGPICVNGTGCPSGTRNLLEYFFPDTYLDGGALAVYPDDLHVDPATTITRTWFLRQTGGSKVQ